MRKGTPTLSSLLRSLAMLEAVIEDGGARGIAAIARDGDIPVATAHRQVRSLVEAGYLTRLGPGRHVAGPRLLRLTGGFDEKQAVASAAAPVLHRLAAELRCIVQLGTLEGEMVTYRVKAGSGADSFFSRVGMQLEAYCSGLGKILLAALPDREREAYLATGPFPALTDRTITDADALRAELARAKARNYAVDDREVADDLTCIAVPVRAGGRIVAAISASRPSDRAKPGTHARIAERLARAAEEIEALADESRQSYIRR
jgi:DNA-binding IclR family transcriptional regulator